MKKLVLCFVFLLCCVSVLGECPEIEVIDVDKNGESCILSVNGNNFVVYERDTLSIFGLLIYVHEVYPVHSKDPADGCEILVSGLPESCENTELGFEEQQGNVSAVNVSEVIVEEIVAVVEEEVVVENVSEEETVPEVEELVEVTVDPKKSVFVKIWEFLKGLF